MTGDQREKVVTDALREFLPPALHIGKGKVFSAEEEPSKQTDIVIFDGRFPVLRQGDSALFPVEGVIATVEVKSALSDESLHDALDKCHSVMKLSPAFVQEDAERFMASAVADGGSREDAIERLVWDLVPRTYIFGFDGLRTTESLTQALTGWLQKGCVGTRNRPFIPSVIVTGGAVGFAWGDPLRIRPTDPTTPIVNDDDVVMASIETTTRFGILACHLLWHIEKRMTLVEGSSPVRRAFNAYVPFEEYINSVIRNGTYALTLWTDRNAGNAPAPEACA